MLVITRALAHAWNILRRTENMMNDWPGSKNSRRPDKAQHTPPAKVPKQNENLTPIRGSWLPMKGVVRKATRQLVPMIIP